MKKILVAYVSRTGKTEKMAEPMGFHKNAPEGQCRGQFLTKKR
jgi:flavodoxin